MIADPSIERTYKASGACLSSQTSEPMTSENKYAPPTAAVTDVPLRPALSVRPKQVRVAAGLLWISFALEFPSFLLAAVRDPQTNLSTGVVVFTVLMCALSALLNLKIYRGANWARIVTLILTLGGCFLMLIPFEEPSKPGVLENSLGVVDLVIDFLALYLLFTKPGSLWFKRLI